MHHRLRLYPRLVGAAWSRLHPAIQDVHTRPGPVQAQARFAVRRRPGRLAGWLLDLARVPAAGDAVTVQLTVEPWDTPAGPRERWRRRFGGRPLVSLQAETPGGLLAERIGPLEFCFRLAVEHGSLVFEQRGCRLRVGPVSARLPHWLAPVIWCREAGTDKIDETVVVVTVSAPGGGLLFSYQGTVDWGPAVGGGPA
jgi:hypothetical protein